ncbi:MAG TPA: protein kinase [Thermoanaerobaculia bacterium]
MSQPATLLEGKYEILSKLREGGMGTIYLVRHRLLDQIRVIKVMRAHARADPDLRRRFVDEAKMATRLNHPNLCTIHDFAVDEDATAYLVMEFIEGVNLAELRTIHGPPGVGLSLEIAHQALLALGYLHRKNVVHRDIASDNLMLSKRDDGVPHVKIIDLGIAKEADRPIEMTATGVFLGKLRYASPEQAGSLPAGEKLDGRSDLYSLGIVLYELITGVRPFAGENPAELLRAQLFNAPVPFEQSDPKGKVPPELRAVILKALEKKRQDRFASAEDFDQQIVAIQRRLGQSDLERTRALLAQLPAVLPAIGTPTPSAQSRLDEHFAPGTTPLPSDRNLTFAPTVSATSQMGIAPAAPAAPQPLPPSTQRPWVWALVGAAVVALAAVLLRTRGAQPATVSRVAESQRTAGAAAPDTRRSEEAPSPAPAAAGVAAAVPTEEPTAPPPPTEAPPPPTRPAAAESAIRRAPRAPRPTPESRRTSFPTAVPVSEALLARPSPAPQVPAPPPPVIPTAPEHPAAASAAPAPPAAPPAPTENDRIRDTIRRYEKAQSTLDAQLYARIFPSVDRERIERAFQSLASQSVEFEVRKIQIDPSGTRARVDGYEKRSAVPRAGTEQRVSADRVLELEKRPDGWIIVRIN